MTQNTNTHFDLHITGFGFLNRIRKVQPSKGKPYWSVTVAALRGDESQKTYIDCSVVGTEAKALFDTHLSAIGENDVVTASFKLSDLYTDTFVYKKGPKQGQPGFSLKARLLQIRYLKVNGHVVFQAASQQNVPQQNAA